MSNTEILAELPYLTAEQRRELFERLCQLQEQDLLAGAGPSPQEKQSLDEALAEFNTDGDAGQPWAEVVARLRRPGAP